MKKLSYTLSVLRVSLLASVLVFPSALAFWPDDNWDSDWNRMWRWQMGRMMKWESMGRWRMWAQMWEKYEGYKKLFESNEELKTLHEAHMVTMKELHKKHMEELHQTQTSFMNSIESNIPEENKEAFTKIKEQMQEKHDKMLEKIESWEMEKWKIKKWEWKRYWEKRSKKDYWKEVRKKWNMKGFNIKKDPEWAIKLLDEKVQAMIEKIQGSEKLTEEEKVTKIEYINERVAKVKEKIQKRMNKTEE